MYNSHKDSAFSLALNIIDGCVQTRRVYQKKEGIGQDIKTENAVDMFRCAYQLANQFKHDNITGLFFELSPILFLKQASEHRELKTTDDLNNTSAVFYYDPVRRLHLLPQYVQERIVAGSWPLPFGNFEKDNLQKIRYISEKLRSDYYYVVKDPYMMVPLSFVPDIDMHWLCPEPEKREERVIDVFQWLADDIAQIINDALEIGTQFPFPFNARTPDRWLCSNITMGNTDWYIPAVLYLLNFFPYRVAELVTDRPTVNVRYILDALGARLPLGDSMEYMQYLFLPLLKYGPFAIRMWIQEKQEKQSQN